MSFLSFTPKHSLADMYHFIDKNENFILFGSDEQGIFCMEWLSNLSKNVLFFLDNSPTKQGTYIKGLEVKGINQVDLPNARIIITSVHSDQIANQLDLLGYVMFEHYIPYDNLYWTVHKQFYDAIGLEFYKKFAMSKNEYLKVLDILSNEESKEAFIKVINYRLTCLHPKERKKDHLIIDFELFKKQAAANNLLYHQLESQLRSQYSNENVISMLLRTMTSREYEYQSKVLNENLGVVIDAGGYIGDTAISFAHNNKSGVVYSFEPSLKNFEQLQALSELFPQIIPVNKGLWDEQKVLQFIEDKDTDEASRIGEGESSIEVIPLDEFVYQQNIKKVDFIKMDIEGAELRALMGAEKTIARDMPDLAISIYHSPEDLWRIPLWIHEKYPQYKLYIDHKGGLFVWGTVCYATIKD